MPEIRQLWDLFIQAECSSYEKSVWCDIFLCLYLAESNEGQTPEEILTFCNWSGVGTLVGCELLSDVDQVCSQPGDGEDLRPLRHHLYTKGWRALAFLLSLGQQNFSCSNELANLLISLYPICLETKETGRNSATVIRTRNKYLCFDDEQQVDHFFSRIPLKNKFCCNQGQFAPRMEYFRSHSNTSNPRSRRQFRGEMSRIAGEFASSESENPSDDLDLVNKSRALKIKLDPMDFDYFTSVVRSDDDSRLDSVLYEPRRRPKHSKKTTPTDFVDDRINDVLKSRVTPYEFSMLIIRLLTSLCQTEHAFTISPGNSYPVCSNSLKFSLENLCSLQFGSVSTENVDGRESADLKAALTRLLVVSLDKVMTCPDVTSNVILGGILPMMLRVLEDSVCKLSPDFNSADSNRVGAKESYEIEKQQEVIFGLICSIVSFLYSLLMQNSDVDRVRNFLELFKIFIESSCGKLIERTIFVLSRFGNAERAKRIIDLTGQLVSGLKKARKEIVDPHSCKRLKHKRCGKNGGEVHHHHDLFGAVFAAPPVVASASCQQNCCVSSLFNVLIRLVKRPRSTSPEIVNRTLKVMTLCGTCCCFDTKNLVQSLTDIIKLNCRKSTSLVFQLLESTIYTELGGYATCDSKITCVICFKNGSDETTNENGQKKASSCDKASVKSGKSGQSDGSVFEGIAPENCRLRFESFKELLLSDDFRTVHQVTCHLLKCSPKMNGHAKYTILFKVFFPSFLTSKAKYLVEADELSAFRISSSLSLFSSLLNDARLAEHFIGQKGLNHVLDLITISNFSKHCCLVLEKSATIAVTRPEANLTPLSMLRSAVDAATDSFFRIFGFARSLSDPPPPPVPVMGIKKRIRLEPKQEKDENKLNLLQQVVTFWRTFANLSLSSPVLRKYFSTHRVFKTDCLDLLQISLSALTSNFFSEKMANQNNFESCDIHLFTKLMESLLTFLLATLETDSKGEEERKKTMQELSETLLNDHLRNVDVRRLAQVLLKCSLLRPSSHQTAPSDFVPKVPAMPTTWTEDVPEMEEKEEKTESDSSSLEDNYVTADEGYEADVEIRDDPFSPGETYSSNSSCSATEAVLPSNEKQDRGDSKNSRSIVYPELCLLAIDLLIKLYRDEPDGDETTRKTVDFNLPDKKESVKNGLEEMQGRCSSLISTFQRLVSLCRDKPQNCAILCQNGVILKLLTGFRDCLNKKRDDFSELQRVVLDLVTVLAKHSISPRELAFFLGFFKEDDPPVDFLLNPLTSLVASHVPRPSNSFSFPLSPRDSDRKDDFSEPDVGKSLHLRHGREGVFSCWSRAGLSLPLGIQLNWSIWSQGFSLSMWIKVDRINWKPWSQNFRPKSPQKQASRKVSKAESHVSACSAAFSDRGFLSDNHLNDEFSPSFPSTPSRMISPLDYFHIFSIGNENLTLECWTSSTWDLLIWRLSRVDSLKGYEIIAETFSENCLPSSSWHHFTINVRDFVQRKKTTFKITTTTNGWKQVETQLCFSGILIRKIRASSLLLGHETEMAKANCRLTNVMLFANPVFTRERSIYLLGLGPDCTNLTDCQIGRRNPNFTSVFGSKTLTSDVNWDAILEDKEANLKELQNHLLLIYSAENPSIVNAYPVMNVPGSLFPGFRGNWSETRSAQQQPCLIFPSVFSHLQVEKYQGLISSAAILGGSATFLFLFARVVEMSDSPLEQSKSLYLLLKLVQSDCDLFSQFVNNDHHKLLYRVFSSPKCKSGLFILKAILDACCDKPIIQYDGNKFQIIQHCDAIIVNSFLISTVVNSWKDWRRSAQESQVLSTLLAALHALVKDEHPSREFNVSQLNRVRMVDQLLSFCKERLLYDEKKNLTVDVCCSLVELVRSLMGAPPEFSHVVSVVDCLLLLHPVNATYVTHVKTSFYLLLSAGQTYTSRGPSHEPKTRINNVETDDVQLNSYTHFENRIYNLNFNAHLKKLYKQDFTQPVDATKLNKALTNLQLKQSCNDDVEDEKVGSGRRSNNDEVDSNLYSDDVTLDSGIAGSRRETIDNAQDEEKIIVKAVDGSQQNLTSFFPSILTESEGKLDAFNETSDEEEKYTNESNQKEVEVHEECGARCLVAEGLLLLLRDTILVLPDNVARQVLNHVIKPETLLVMANHRDHRVRSAVVKVLFSYLQRCSEEETNRFLKMRGFHHLANQISLFPASLGLVQDCLQLVTKCNFSLEDQNCWSQLESTTLETSHLSHLPPLLALLPRSVHDFSLAHNLVCIIRSIYCKDMNCSKSLIENGLLEVLVKALVFSAHVGSVVGDASNQDLVVLEIEHFLVIIVTRALNLPGLQNMQIISDIRLQLNYVYRLEKETCGVKSRCVRVIRETLCRLLEKTLEYVHDRITCLQSVDKGKFAPITTVPSFVRPDHEGDRSSSRTGSTRSHSDSSSSITNLVSSHSTMKDVPRTELSERLKIIVTSAIHFFIFSESVEGKYSSLSQTELNFIYRLVPMLLQMLSRTLEKRGYGRRQVGTGVYWAVRDTLRQETAELIVWLLSPRHAVKTRLFAITTLMSETKNRDLIATLLQAHPQTEQKFTVFLWELMYNNKLTNADLRICQELKECLQQWGIVSPHSLGSCHDLWGDECDLLLDEMDKQMALWDKQTEASTIRCITKHDQVVKGMSEEAMTMTRIVVDAQNGERKVLMEQIKSRYSESIQTAGKWRDLVGRLTHEKGVWFFPESHPQFWELDSTEGPSRVRKRLSRCRLGLDERYLLPKQRHKLEAEKHAGPLFYLFEQQQEACTSTVLIERLHSNEKIRTMIAAKIVTPANEIPGELLVGETSLYFVVDDKTDHQNFDVSNTAWSLEDVKEIHSRRYQLQERAIEIFLVNGTTWLIAFQSSKERDALMAELLDCNLPNRIAGDNLADVLHLWREGLITNWDYLTQLNKMAGRSYNDLMQYPVFPFVLADYTSPTLDLTNPNVYRNFKKPMAVQDKKNEQHYVNNYNELLSGLKQVTLNKEPYHYGSHYSNSGTVLHFLVRLPPFTKMMLQYQDRNFDLPDRTFHSMHTTWRLTSCESTTDVKEMLPEFFFLPEFLVNDQGFNFGVRQNGEVVDDVELPPWSKGDARRFVLVHRQALESDHVTENLPHWIDLVFGYKQTGKAAVDAINVFHPATYCGFDVESISDPLERVAWETMVKTYGQTPRQLLKTPHPLVVQSFVASSAAPSVPVTSRVKGLKWGSYVGSPAEAEPTVVWKQQNKEKRIVAKLLPLSTNDVFGLPPRTASLLRYNKDKGLNLVNSPSIRAALVSWGHSDGILRLKLRKDRPPIPLVSVSHSDPITIISSAPECNQLWMGHSSGNISVYKFYFIPDKETLDFSPLATRLQGHRKSVVVLTICRSFSVVVSGDRDGLLIIWDLNRMSYVRSVEIGEGPIGSSVVSETLGDVATVSFRENKESVLHLHTVNGSFVASTVFDESVTALCYSTAPEGISVNVIACGLESGVIRLLSSWDLSRVRDISLSSLNESITSLTYSYDCHHLYASFSDGSVVVWESKNGSKIPKFLNLASLK